MAELIRTGRAAAILGTSRQHVVDLVNRGLLANHGHGVQRRVDAAEVEALAGQPRPRDGRLSLWLHHAIAGRIVRAPIRSMAEAAHHLDTMLIRASSEGRSLEVLNHWRRLLGAGPEAVLRAISAESDVADALRRESPFVMWLSEAEVARGTQTFEIAQRPRQSLRWQRERASPKRRFGRLPERVPDQREGEGGEGAKG